MWFQQGFEQNVPLFIIYMNKNHNGNFKIKKIIRPPPNQQIRLFTFFHAFFHYLPYINVLSSLLLCIYNLCSRKGILSAFCLLGMVEDWGLEDSEVWWVCVC